MREASPTSAPSSPRSVNASRLTTAVVVATIAFWAYTQTLLPGVDLGDTGGFQAAVPWPAVSARQAYPLYYSLAKPFVALLGGEHPARALNLFSAFWGAGAIGVLTWLVADIAASALAGAAAGLLFAFSYTFWTQAIIAEVYTLHLTLIGACLVALRVYAARPTRGRLAIFFAIYALSFGNHLSMILLLIPAAAFLVAVHPSPRELFRPSVVLMAVAIAIAGALQYTPNFLHVWSGLDAPSAWDERIAAFWFDTTKADWRDTMVLGVGGKLGERLAMWQWDARQQFGIAGLLLAAAGAVRVWWLSRSWALLLWMAYAFTTAFAVTYNVGDSHVFFLPSHFFTAIFAGLAVSWAAAVRPALKAAPASLAAAALIAFAIDRGWDTWPAVDRHDDRRAEALVGRLASGIGDQQAVLVSEMDWQSENALLYSSRWERRDLPWLRLGEVLPRFPFFVADNHAIDRDVVLTGDAAADVVATYGALFPFEPMESPGSGSLAATVRNIPRGAPYVITVLRPAPADVLDAADVGAALTTLTDGRMQAWSGQHFEVIAGVNGEAPTFHHTSARPFREQLAIAGDPFTVRMESWLPDDTFRRAGFGQVLRGRERILIVERGVSLVWFGASGEPRTAYAAGLYAPRPRYRIPRATLHLARLPSGS
jgi:hypothetical protein